MESRASTTKSPRVEVICVGTELLTGHLNTHTAYLGPKLAEIGLSIAREHAVGDDRGLMKETFSESFKRSQIVLCAGGLGPTFDDITRDVWSKVLGRPMKLQDDLVSDIKEKFRARGVKMPPMNRRQALVLKGAQPIFNSVGTAPGQMIMVGKKLVVLLPGPSRELYPMMERTVIPKLRALYPERHLIQKTFQIFGFPESQVDQMIRPWVAKVGKRNECRITHGILASQSVVSVKFTVEGRSFAAARSTAQTLGKEVRHLFGKMIFGEGRQTLEEVVGHELRTHHKTLAVAESCTGGTIAKLMTENAGASKYFLEGVVTYSNESKTRHLGVPKTMLDRYGAVSFQVAEAMAEGLKRKTQADYALSVTGIAGPSGGSLEKPVGLVFIGLAGPRGTTVKQFNFVGERGLIRHRASLTALDLLRREFFT